MLNNLFAAVVFTVLSQYSWFTHVPSDLDLSEQETASFSMSVPSVVDTD